MVLGLDIESGPEFGPTCPTGNFPLAPVVTIMGPRQCWFLILSRAIVKLKSLSSNSRSGFLIRQNVLSLLEVNSGNWTLLLD